MDKDLCFPCYWLYPVFSKLVDAVFAITTFGKRYILYSVNGWRIFMFIGCWGMDVPATQKQYDGRCFQFGERKLHAGNPPDGE